MKKLLVLGVSGSIGTQTYDICKKYPEDFELVGVSVYSNMTYLKQILDETFIPYVGIKEPNPEFEANYPNTKFFYGEKGIVEMCRLNEYNLLVNALVGFRGLIPTLTAITSKKDVALANKESLVVAGDLVNKALKQYDVKLYPIDSEHSAIFQCLEGNDSKEVKRLIVTASGGAFRDLSIEELRNVTVEQALHHPTWNMGKRITIDSATMMNKGFEIIEAHHLFNIPYDQIDVLLHKESIIHSMVEYKDHSIIAQMSHPDMHIPIQYALSYPKRYDNEITPSLRLEDVGSLNFSHMDKKRYPLVQLAYFVGQKGGNLGAVLNGADEMAIELFIDGKISFLDIQRTVIQVVKDATYIKEPSLKDLVEADAWARKHAKEIGNMKFKVGL